MADQHKDDEILGKAYDSKLMKRLLEYIKPYKKYVALAIILNILVAALGPVRPYLVHIAIDESIVQKDYNTLLNITLLLLLSLIFQAVVQFFLTYYTMLINENLTNTEIINQIVEDYTMKSKKSRVSKSRRLIREFPDYVAMIINENS